MLKSGMLLVGNGLLVKLLGMVRTVIIARIVTVEDYGIIATFMLTLSLAEMASAFALDRLVVQDRQGDDPRFVATLQTLQVLRGLFGGLLVLLIAVPYAALLGVEDLVWPYQALALVPFLAGFNNLSFYSPQRRRDFRRLLIWQIIRPVCELAMLAVLILIFDDWRIGLAITLGGQIVATVTTHLLSTRRFGLWFDREIALRAMRFGWPLLLNNILLYAILNGDRIIVSNQIGLEALAYFSAALALVQIPVAVVTNAHQNLFLPDLSRKQDSPADFDHALVLAIQSRAALAIVLLLGVALVGPDLLLLVYSDKYSEAMVLVLWTGLLSVSSMLKGAPNIVALSRAATTNPLYSNLLRVCSLPVAYLAFQAGATLIHLIVIATIAELLAFALAMWLVRRTNGGRLPRGAYTGSAAALAVFALMAVDAALFPAAETFLGSLHLFQIALVAASAAALLSMGALRRWLLRKLAGRRSGAGAGTDAEGPPQP